MISFYGRTWSRHLGRGCGACVCVCVAGGGGGRLPRPVRGDLALHVWRVGKINKVKRWPAGEESERNM